MEKYTYQPLDFGRPAIRLLHLYQGAQNSKIFCSLFQAELLERDKTISYEALSYTWGSANLARRISVDGYYLNVTLEIH